MGHSAQIGDFNDPNTNRQASDHTIVRVACLSADHPIPIVEHIPQMAPAKNKDHQMWMVVKGHENARRGVKKEKTGLFCFLGAAQRRAKGRGIALQCCFQLFL